MAIGDARYSGGQALYSASRLTSLAPAITVDSLNNRPGMSSYIVSLELVAFSRKWTNALAVRSHASLTRHPGRSRRKQLPLHTPSLRLLTWRCTAKKHATELGGKIGYEYPIIKAFS